MQFILRNFKVNYLQINVTSGLVRNQASRKQLWRVCLDAWRVGLITLFLISCDMEKQNDDLQAEPGAIMNIQLIPQPQHLSMTGGQLVLSGQTPVVAEDPQFEFSATLLEASLAKLNGGTAGGDTASGTRIQLTKDDQLSESAYKIVIDMDAVTLSAATSQGMFYAVQTLRQVLFQARADAEGMALPLLKVEDSPQFSYRGMHLDVSRHFFDVEFIKKYIDLIALHKMNYFHWHLTDDQGWRIEINKYPGLTEIGSVRPGTVVGHTSDADAKLDGIEHGGYYTQQQIREVVDYAAQRHITIIPEIDVPGHAAAIIAAYPEFGCGPLAEVETHFGVFKHVLCPTEQTFSFLDDVFREVAELFPGPYIHIGGDEVIKDHWQDCARCQALMQREGLEDLGQLQAYFINRTEKIVNAYGKSIIGWDEILDGDVNPSATVMSWRGMEGGLRASSMGHDVIMTPVSQVYFDFYQSNSRDEPQAIHGLTRLRDVYQFNPAPAGVTAEQRQRILGGQANLWTEYVKDGDAVEYMLLPRMSALAEVLWTQPEQQSVDGFIDRLETFGPFLKSLGYRVANSHYKPEIDAELVGEGKFLISMAAERGQVHYSLDGSLPDAQSPRYQQPFTLDHSATVRARTLLPESGDWHGDTVVSLDAHLALGLDVQFAHETDPQWNANADRTIVNGALGSDRIFHYEDWVAFNGNDMDAVIDFQAPVTVQQVSIGVDAGLHRELHRPSSFAVYVPGDTNDWLLAGSLSSTEIEQSGNRLAVSFEPVEITRLRIVAVNDKNAWSAEKQRLQPITLFVDEITVH